MEVYENKNECCGCSACMNICPKKAIEMVQDEEGFLYPKINEEKCIQCGLCKKICAFQNGYDIDGRLEKLIVYAAKSKSDKTRMESSSGGMFTEISKYVLENKGIVYGVAFNKNFKAEHIRCDNEEQVNKCKGSKYSQSDLKDTFRKVKEDLKNDKMVLFTGTPCQIAGINRYLENVNKEKLILVDIVCHGVPSPKIFSEYIKFCEEKNKSKIKEYYHRSKDNGQVHNEKAIYENGKQDGKSLLSQAWKYIFYSNLALRPSCYNCKYANDRRASDITIADFWGIEQFAPEFADKKGISCVIINTYKGKEIFKKIEDNVEFIEKTIEEAKIKNLPLKGPYKVEEEKRKKFWKEYNKYKAPYIIKKYGRYNIVCKAKKTIKNIMKIK